MVRVSLGYPSADAEAAMLAGLAVGDRVLEVEPVADTATSRSARWLPMKPALPVMTALMDSLLSNPTARTNQAHRRDSFCLTVQTVVGARHDSPSHLRPSTSGTTGGPVVLGPSDTCAGSGRMGD